jgi:hypothetical protein
MMGQSSTLTDAEWWSILLSKKGFSMGQGEGVGRVGPKKIIGGSTAAKDVFIIGDE